MSAEVLAERATRFAALSSDPATVATLLERATLYGELRRLVDGLGIGLAGELDAFVEQNADGARKLGERSPVAVMQVCAGLDGAEAAAMCKVGAAVQPQVNLQGEVLPSRHEALEGALAQGGMRVGRATRVVSTLDEISMFASPSELVAVEHFLVEQSAELTDRQFARVCRELPEKFVPDTTADREAYLRRRSGLVMRDLPDGLVQWIITMHPEAAGFAKAALDARTAPRRQPTFAESDEPLENDPRTTREKRLDAFVSMCRESIARDTGKVAGASVTMVVTMTLDALLSGLGKAKISGVDEPISAATARRLAAGADVIPVVLGGCSEVLDLGREVRLGTEAQRRALDLRDQGCIWPGCSAPPGWCEVAHKVPWFEGGCTDLDNLMLLCPFHHRVYDLEGWALEWRGGVRCFIPPAWVDSAQTPRRAGPLPQFALV